MTEATTPIPPVRPEDSDEIAVELKAAAVSWASGDKTEALSALRRAASNAYRLQAGRRVSELAKAVADIAKTIGMTGRPPPPKLATKMPPPLPNRPAVTSPALASNENLNDIPIDVNLDDDPAPISAAPAPAPPKRPSNRPPKKDPPPSKARRSTPPKAPVVAAAPAPAIAEEKPNGVADSPTSKTQAVAQVVNPALQHLPTPQGEDDPARPTTTPDAPQMRSNDDQTPAPSPAIDTPTRPLDDAPTLADLEGIATLERLDEEGRKALLQKARLIVLEKGKSIPAPAMLVVVRGVIDVQSPGRKVSVERVDAKDLRLLAPSPPAQEPLVVFALAEETRLLALDADPRALKLGGDVVAVLEAQRDGIHAFAGALREKPVCNLADGMLVDLRKRCEVRRLPEGTVIVRAGEDVRALVIVACGSLTQHAAEGQPETGRIRAGEVMCPRELLDEKPSPREIMVPAGGVLVLAARRTATVSLLEAHPLFKEALKVWSSDDPLGGEW